MIKSTAASFPGKPPFFFFSPFVFARAEWEVGVHIMPVPCKKKAGPGSLCVDGRQ